MMSWAPTARAASSAPSITRCGRDAISDRSLGLSGSPSAPLPDTTPPPPEEPPPLQPGDPLARSDGWERPEALLVRGEAFGAGRRPDQLHLALRGEASCTCRQAWCERPLTLR